MLHQPRNLFFLFSISLSLFAVSCLNTTSSNEKPTANQNLKNQEPSSFVMDLDNGSKLEFLNDQYGNVTISEEGKIGVASILADEKFEGKSPLEIFKTLRPNSDIPAVLLNTGDMVSAEETVQNRISDKNMDSKDFEGENEKNPEQKISGPLSKAALTETQFENNYCDSRNIIYWYNPPYNWATTKCLLSRTNNAQHTMYNVREGFGIVYVYRGNLSLQRRYRTSGSSSWASNQSWSVSEGNWKSARMWSSSGNIDYDVRYNVNNASGDGWHFAGQKGYEVSCNPGCSWDGSVCKCGI